MAITPNMGLTTWSLVDFFNHAQLSQNFIDIDNHDHTSAKGAQIPSSGIAPLAITTAKIADGAVTGAKFAGSLSAANITDGSVTSGKIANQAITATQIGALPSARVYSSTPFAIPNSALTAISFDTTRFNTGLWTSSNPTVLTATATGAYVISGSVHWATSGSGTYRLVGLYKNATDLIAATSRSPVTSATGTRYTSVSTVFRLSAGDYVQLVAQQDTGAALDVEVQANASPELAMTWLSL